MSTDRRPTGRDLWLAGVIWLGLGIAYDELILTIGAIVAFAFQIHAANRAERPDPEHTGRCGHTLDSWSRTAALVCALPAGHAGWHRDENRAEWSPDQTTWKGTQ